MAASIDSFSVTSASTPNEPPAVSIISPTTGTQFTLPETLTITASASDAEDGMASVDFYADQALIGRATTAPYTVAWSPAAAGTYSLTAVASDAAAASSTSAAVTVTVANPNASPVVTLTGPVNGSTFEAPGMIELAATASDPESRLAGVEFFSGTTLLGVDTTVPYTFSFTNVPAGTYSLRANAFDAEGASATSEAVSVTVYDSPASAVPATEPPTTVPRYLVFSASFDHGSNVTSYFFEVFPSGSNPETAVAIVAADLGKPAPDASNDITSDQQALFNALPAGRYVATITAVGPGGRTRGAAVTFDR
jgi:hypothetical protein